MRFCKSLRESLAILHPLFDYQILDVHNSVSLLKIVGVQFGTSALQPSKPYCRPQLCFCFTSTATLRSATKLTCEMERGVLLISHLRVIGLLHPRVRLSNFLALVVIRTAFGATQSNSRPLSSKITTFPSGFKTRLFTSNSVWQIHEERMRRRSGQDRGHLHQKRQ